MADTNTLCENATSKLSTALLASGRLANFGIPITRENGISLFQVVLCDGKPHLQFTGSVARREQVIKDITSKLLGDLKGRPLTSEALPTFEIVDWEGFRKNVADLHRQKFDIGENPGGAQRVEQVAQQNIPAGFVKVVFSSASPVPDDEPTVLIRDTLLLQETLAAKDSRNPDINKKREYYAENARICLDKGNFYIETSEGVPRQLIADLFGVQKDDLDVRPLPDKKRRIAIGGIDALVALRTTMEQDGNIVAAAEARMEEMDKPRALQVYTAVDGALRAGKPPGLQHHHTR